MNSLVKVVLVLLALPILSGPLALAEDERTWVLDDFEDGDLKASPGLSWFALGDDMLGGATDVRLENRSGGPAGSRRALRLSGRLGGGKSSFAGAWAPLEGTGGSVDVSAFEGLRLRVKSDVPLQIGIRAGSINYMADIAPAAGWRQVEVAFATLQPLGKVKEGTKWNATKVEIFGITTPQLPSLEERPAGDLAFEVDDIALYSRGEEAQASAAAQVPTSAQAATPAPTAVGGPGSTILIPFAPLSSIPSKGWVELTSDPSGDGRQATLPDATRLEAIPSSKDGLFWLRVTLREAPSDKWLGMNAVLDVDGDPANGTAWWGANKDFKFDRLVSVWCLKVEGGCQGMIGVAGADQVMTGVMSEDGSAGRMRLAVDREHRALVVAFPREALHLKSDPLRMVVAVGSAFSFNDDVPGDGAVTVR
jgi:hypothetical protein